MSVTTRRLFPAVVRAVFSRAAFTERTAALRPKSVRPLAVSAHWLARASGPGEDADEEELSEPIKFSSSKASHRNWKVQNSMGGQHKRPWWKAISISVCAVAFLLWCVLREETDIDDMLGKQLYEHLPGLLPENEEEQQVERKQN